MKIFITGDTHGNIDRLRLSRRNFPDSKKLSRDDYVIIAGDFGEVWHGSSADDLGINWHGVRKYRTLFIDGNHENFDVLDELPLQQWGEGFVHYVHPTVAQKGFKPVIHLLRGLVYELHGKTFFTFGGGNSIDKSRRLPGRSWWYREMPSRREYDRGIEVLTAHNWTVDYVITHTCPTQYLYELIYGTHKPNLIGNELTEYLSMIYAKLNFKMWFFGHFHMDRIIEGPKGKLIALYQNIYEIVDGGIKLSNGNKRDDTIY